MKAKEVKNAVNWDFMKPVAITIEPDATVMDAITIMNKFQIHHLLVMEKDQFKGLVEGRDLMFFSQYSTGPLNNRKVSDVMRKNVPMIYDSTEVGGVLDMMLSYHLSAVPVVEKGKIVGIVTETDLLKLLNKMLGRNHRLPILAQEGEAILANPLLQNLFRILENLGL